MFFNNQDIFNVLFEAIPEGVIIVDEEQIIVAANASAEKMFGFEKGELINKFLNNLIPVKHQDKYKKHFINYINTSTLTKEKTKLNLYGITKSKKIFPAEISLNPFKVANKTFVIALIIDVTKRKETKQKIDKLNNQLEKTINAKTIELKKTIKQLQKVNLNYKKEIKNRIEGENKIMETLKKERELNELKTKFLSLVSHEFKTPLSGILTSSMLLKKYPLQKQQNKRDKHIETISKKVHYLNNILNDFLSIERLESSNVNYKFTTFNLNKIISEVVYNANMLLKSGQKINISPNINDYILYQDEKILELILSNLLYNAIKYSFENTTIELDVYQNNNNNIVFKLKDEGVGIPENDQKFIFNRYFRAENVLNIQGTGTSLNIVKTHLENLNGSIAFTSIENKGSVFIVELPLIKVS